MAYYVFGELLAPDYDEHLCLGGPYATLDEVREAVKINGWLNWITGDGPKAFTPGQKYKIPAPLNPAQPGK